MTTTVTSLIGSGATYSTMQAWEDACPPSLTAVDQIWRGECLNQDLSAAGSGLACNFSGTTTDATRYLELTTRAGASFADHISAQVNPLRFDASMGASATCAGGYNNTIVNNVDYTRISKLMLAVTAASSAPLGNSAALTVDQCILESNGQAAYTQSASLQGTLRNTLFVNRGSAALRIVAAGGPVAFYNCTFVVPSDKTPATYGIDGSYSSPSFIENCAVFGATTVIEAGNSSFTVTTSRCDASSPPSGFTQIAYDTGTGSGFQNITDATRDFRLKSSSAMLDVGTTDATNAATDIVGTARPQGSAYDIGAWEYVSTVAASSSPSSWNRRTPWRSQPQLTPTIDWSNPITRKLSFCAVPVGNNFLDLVTGVLATRSGTGVFTPVVQGRNGGQSTDGGSRFIQGPNTSSTETYDWPISNTQRGGAAIQEASVLCLGGNSTQVDGEQYIFGGNGENVSLGDGYFLGIDSFIYTGRGGVARGRYSSIQDVSQALIANPFNNQTHFFGYSFRSNGAAGTYFLKGVGETFVNAGLTHGTTATNRQTRLYSNTAGTGSIRSQFIALFLIWDREISTTEYASLYLNPWQLFAPLTRRLWLPTSTTTPAGVPTLSAATVTSILTTAATPRVTLTF